jgi:Glycosyl transferase family 2
MAARRDPDGSALGPGRAKPATVTPVRKVLFSAMKNEAPFVLEWIAYHQVIGFTDIVICSNPSNDGLEELLAALADAGEIRHLRTVPGAGEGALRAASMTFTREVGYHPGTWYMWLDGDEFLNVHAGDHTVDALIAAMGDRLVAPVNWRVFGTSGQPSFGGRFIASDFTGAAEPGFKSNLEQKAFFRFAPEVRGFGVFGINRPTFHRGSGMTADQVMMGNGEGPVAEDRITTRWLNGADIGKTAWSRPEEFGWRHAQINHYVLRTPEFYRLKRARGRGYTANPDTNGLQRYTDQFFADHDRNEAEDRSILTWEAAVTDRIAQLLAYPAVAKAKARSDALVGEALAALDAAQSQPAGVASPKVHTLGIEEETEQPSFELTFDEKEVQLVHLYYEAAETILEYGSGGSTVLGARLGRRVFSVESDRTWARQMAQHVAPISDRVHVHWADVGATGPWGIPLKSRPHRKFHRYALSVWDRPDFVQPDLVLVDGRFRAACVVATMLRTKKPVTLLFDDYRWRKHYHGVERVAHLEQMAGRMARFTVTPGAIPPDMVTEAIGWFADMR